jgi:hypothetical protein
VNFNIISFICFLVFGILFSLMVNGISFGSAGKIAIISMFLFPLLGALFGVKGKKGAAKWVLTILNVAVLLFITYILLLGFGIGEA